MDIKINSILGYLVTGILLVPIAVITGAFVLFLLGLLIIVELWPIWLFLIMLKLIF